MPRIVLITTRVLLVVAAVGITVLSLQPDQGRGPGEWDKLAHALAYAVLAFMLVLAVPSGPVTVGRVLLLVSLAALYGVVIELVQRYVGRQMDVADMVANAIGAAIGGVPAVLVRRAIARWWGSPPQA